MRDPQLWRGALIALALVTFSIGVWALVARAIVRLIG